MQSPSKMWGHKIDNFSITALRRCGSFIGARGVSKGSGSRLCSSHYGGAESVRRSSAEMSFEGDNG